jgi:hypothetical protein
MGRAFLKSVNDVRDRKKGRQCRNMQNCETNPNSENAKPRLTNFAVTIIDSSVTARGESRTLKKPNEAKLIPRPPTTITSAHDRDGIPPGFFARQPRARMTEGGAPPDMEITKRSQFGISFGIAQDRHVKRPGSFDSRSARSR